MKKIKTWSPTFPVDENGFFNFSMLLIAKRYSGKTYLVKYLYDKYLKYKYDAVLVFAISPTLKSYKQVIRRIGNQMIKFLPTEEDEKYERNLKIIKTIINKNKKLTGRNKINTLIIFDDTNSNKEKFSKQILQLFAMGRHHKISIIYNTQSPTLVSNAWKENTDLMVIFSMKSRRYKEYIVDNIVSNILGLHFKSVQAEKNFYIRLFETITLEKFNCAVLDFRNDELNKYKAGKF